MKLGLVSRISEEDIRRFGDSPKWLSALLGPLNGFIQVVVSVLTNNLTFADNFAGAQVTIKVAHNTEVLVNPRVKSRVSAVYLNSASGEIVTGFGWRYTDTGILAITVQFSAGAGTEASCTFQVLTG